MLLFTRVDVRRVAWRRITWAADVFALVVLGVALHEERSASAEAGPHHTVEHVER